VLVEGKEKDEEKDKMRKIRGTKRGGANTSRLERQSDVKDEDEDKVRVVCYTPHQDSMSR
jgi:hypothetical protein